MLKSLKTFQLQIQTTEVHVESKKVTAEDAAKAIDANTIHFRADGMGGGYGESVVDIEELNDE